MNKYIRILILIVIAACILLLLQCPRKADGIDSGGNGSGDSSNSEIGFWPEIKSLGNLNWNKQTYQKINDKLVIYKLEGSIDEDLAISLENALMASYAKSINNTVKSWLNNGCIDPSVNEVYREIIIITNKNDNCKTILSNYKETIESYRAALSLNARVNNHICQEYIDSVHQSILADIEHLSNLPSLNSCSIIRDNYLKLIDDMKNFENFALNYNSYITLRLNDAKYAETQLRRLCAENDPNQNQYVRYKFYQTELNNQSLCP
jgi:hypothetical protein